MRKFQTGATRNDDNDRLDFEGFLNPLVIERYAQYMHKHRFQADGEMRASDNWQKLFGANHYEVCLKSLLRHIIDVWKRHRKGERSGAIEDSICACIFNLQAYLFKILKDKETNKETNGE